MERLINLDHLLKGEKPRKDQGIRSFSNWDYPDDPHDNWGLEGMAMPQWVLNSHNTMVGERAFIFGSGPSIIEQEPLLNHMQHEYTWTCNRIRKWENLPFTPFVHCITEPGPLVNYGQFVASVYDFPGAQNKISAIWWKVTAPGWLWLPKAPDDIQIRWQGFFGCGDYLPPIPSGWASPLTISQLVAWMGYSELYYLGIDTTQVGQAWDREKGTTKEPRSILSTLECFDRARMTLQAAGRKVYDCTPGGRVNQEGVLEYRDLKEVLSGNTA